MVIIGLRKLLRSHCWLMAPDDSQLLFTWPFYVHPLADEGTKNEAKRAGSGYTAEGGVQQRVWCQSALHSTP